MTALIITVPLPPSANALTRNVKGRGRVNTAAYNAWLEKAGYSVRMAHRAAGSPAFEKPLEVTLQLGLRDRRRDAGNCLKPTEDMLVKSIEGLPDDRWNDSISIKRDATVPEGMARITITSMPAHRPADEKGGEGGCREAHTDCKSPVSLSSARSALTPTRAPDERINPMVETIFDLPDASPSELAELPPEKLLLFQGAVAAFAADAAKLSGILHSVLVARFAAGLNSTGTHNLDAGTVKVAVTIPKKVKWDQEKLNAASETLIGWGENPTDYVEFEIKVSERKYDAWPPAVRDVFTPARTVETGKPVIKLTSSEVV